MISACFSASPAFSLPSLKSTILFLLSQGISDCAIISAFSILVNEGSVFVCISVKTVSFIEGSSTTALAPKLIIPASSFFPIPFNADLMKASASSVPVILSEESTRKRVVASSETCRKVRPASRRTTIRKTRLRSAMTRMRLQVARRTIVLAVKYRNAAMGISKSSSHGFSSTGENITSAIGFCKCSPLRTTFAEKA